MGITQQIGASSLIKPGVIDNAAARPASPYEGQVIFQKDTDQLLVWNGTAWVIPNSPAQNPMGLELVKTQTVGSGVGSVTVSDVFSATYDNYVITYQGGTISSAANINLALGSSTTNYFQTLVYGAYTGTSPLLATTNNNRVAWAWAGGGDTNSVFVNVTLMAPFLSYYTRILGGAYEGPTASGWTSGIHKTASSYTAFTLTPEAGTLSGGTITVYGYRK
jgi:hypothetical protein